MPFVKVASINDVEDGSGKVVMANGQAIALFKIKGNFYAINNTCAHRGGPLGEGFLEDNVVTCPLHGWRYDVTNGKCLTMPLQNKAFTVKVEGDDVLVEV